MFGTPDHPTDLAIRWASFFRLSDISAFLLNGLAACMSTIGAKRPTDSRECCCKMVSNSFVTSRSAPF